MTEKRYALGVDFGELGARAVLVRLDGGGVEGSASLPYAHGVFPLPEARGKAGGGWSCRIRRIIWKRLRPRCGR